MKTKLLTTFLLSLVIVSGCKRSKKNVIVPATSPGNTVIVEKIDKQNRAQRTSEDADDFALEDNAAFNVFEDDEIKQVESSSADDNFTWDEDENESEFETVQFDYDSAEIKTSEKSKIIKNAETIKKHLSSGDTSRVIVKGHSCKIANNQEYNHVLSQERAQNIGYAYEKQGISHEYIKPVGYGSSLLLTDEDGMDSQAKNRRVETELTK